MAERKNRRFEPQWSVNPRRRFSARLSSVHSSFPSFSSFALLTSSWAPFLTVTAGLLKPNGRMAFLVPAEVGHAPYARPLVDFLASNFGKVLFLAVRSKLFPELSEDVWILYAEGFGN